MSWSDKRDRLLIIGASARAAAFSALRAGLFPTCADLFGDTDLASWCDVHVVSGKFYLQALEQVADAAPAGPWIYTGALENRPALVGRIAARRELWGNGPDVLRPVRDPFHVAACLSRAGLAHPAVRQTGERLTQDRDWLVKPRDGAGGRGIRLVAVLDDAGFADRSGFPGNSGQQSRGSRRNQSSPAAPSSRAARFARKLSQQNQPPRICNESEVSSQPNAPRYFCQEQIDGLPCAAVFVAGGGQAALVGVTEQLVGDGAFHARPFQYCGSIGPLKLEPRTMENCRAVGNALASEFTLCGLFGIDGILRDDVFWPVEINPRYTASVEILEHALGVPLLALHRDACLSGTIPDDALCRTVPEGQAWGKVVLFAPSRLIARHLDQWQRKGLDPDRPWRWPQIADIPGPETWIAAGRPVITVFATGRTREACYVALKSEARELFAQFSATAG